LTIENYEDNFIADNSTYYYPKTIITNHISSNDFKKAITIIWRRVWPKGRKGQTKILGNRKINLVFTKKHSYKTSQYS
jgi:hypothetical protein